MKTVAAWMAAGIVLMVAPSAHATTWCVKDPACPAGANASHATITGAVLASAAGDKVLIGPGKFEESVPLALHALDIRGAGAQKTIIQSPGSQPTTTFRLGADSYLKNVGIELSPGPHNTGLELAGTASRVVVTAPAHSATGVGVSMVQGTLEHSTIALAVGGASTTIGAQISPLSIGGGDIEDSSITAATGIDGIFQVVRDRILATVGFTGTQARAANGGEYEISDTLVETTPGVMPETGIAFAVSPDMTNNPQVAVSCNCLHLTIFGSGSPGSIGIRATGTADANQPAFNLSAFAETILRGYATSVSRTATGTGDPALVNVSLRFSDFAPGTEHSSNSGTGNGMVFADATDINRDPLFASTSFARPVAFHLRVRSPAIDAGAPIEPGNTSPLDAAEAPRDVDGRNTGEPVADMGAFEFQPHAPTAVARGPRTAPVGARIAFNSRGSHDVDLGDSLRFTWRFDDGARLRGRTVHHAFTTSGKHAAVLTVTDFYGRRGTAVATVLVHRRRHR